MDSTSFQILSNLKIFTTAILYYFIIGKNINRTKWFALFLLFVASVFYTIGNYKSKNEISDNQDVDNYNLLKNKQFYITKIGIILTIIFSLISGFSGVYNEYLFKLNFSDSIYIQNMYIYFYGCILNLIARIFENLKEENSFHEMMLSWSMSEFFKGFTPFTWIIVFIQVLGGISMSVVMKYASNITRLFIISSSLVVTIGLSVLIFSLTLNIYFYCCLLAIFVALYLYITS